MSHESETLSRLDAVRKAMTCEHCGALRAILDAGITCPNGCGKILPFSLAAERYGLGEYIRETEDPYEVNGRVADLLRKEFPQQRIEPRGAGEVTPASPGAAGTRAKPRSQKK